MGDPEGEEGSARLAARLLPVRREVGVLWVRKEIPADNISFAACEPGAFGGDTEPNSCTFPGKGHRQSCSGCPADTQSFASALFADFPVDGSCRALSRAFARRRVPVAPATEAAAHSCDKSLAQV